MNKKTILRLMILVFVGWITFVNWDDIKNINITDFVSNSENIYITMAVILGLFALKSVIFILPIPMLYISSGMVLPIYIAIVVNIAGVLIEVSLTYIYGKFLGADYIDKIVCKSKKLQRGLELNQQNEFIITFLLRITPVNIEMVSLMLGASGNYYRNYLLASLMGLVPKLIIFTIIGYTMTNPVTFAIVALFSLALLTWGALIMQLKKRDLVSGFRG
ncbi:VTT domain-containing protein [Alkalicella caledoniensis]|uniref:TVP38/TMEM64 family membrane protein n=1 Tax=Alkalicella caledoniensis TaxID=2731377 RepID=A0A7G9W7Q7_ALKCA|nr:VTT domain-containing protein [Alkalicella caledoniensis]QNO14719.1 VTT domain-containing protein [Alkalicella caledoniensis]